MQDPCEVDEMLSMMNHCIVCSVTFLRGKPDWSVQSDDNLDKFYPLNCHGRLLWMNSCM